MLIIPYEKNIFCFQKAQWKARGLERPSEGEGAVTMGEASSLTSRRPDGFVQVHRRTENLCLRPGICSR